MNVLDILEFNQDLVDNFEIYLADWKTRTLIKFVTLCLYVTEDEISEIKPKLLGLELSDNVNLILWNNLRYSFVSDLYTVDNLKIDTFYLTDILLGYLDNARPYQYYERKL